MNILNKISLRVPTGSVAEWLHAPKPNNPSQVRICGDYRLSLKTVIKRERHPIPTFDELLEELAGAKKFSKIDLRVQDIIKFYRPKKPDQSPRLQAIGVCSDISAFQLASIPQAKFFKMQFKTLYEG